MNELGSIAPAPDRSGDERWALVQRVVSSRNFHKSARQREFLLYIAECALANRLENVTEQSIGCRVFERPQGYDPAEDNIVRVAARQLRIKLREYFETEGHSEALTIEVPKGGYVPVFHHREGNSPPAAPVVSEAMSGARSRRFLPLWALGLLIAFVLPLAWLWQENQALRRELRTKLPVPNPLVSALKGSPSNRLTIVIADSTFGILVNNLGKTISLEDYTARRFPALPDSGRWAGAQDFFNRLLQNRLTSIADAELASRIVRSASEHHVDVRLRHARDLIVRDFHSDNVVIIGGPRTNPWTQLLEQTLNFQFEIDPHTNLREIVNHSPRPGENPRYSDGSPKVGVSYARVAVVPNLGKSGRVFLIGGTKMAATEAAGDFILAPAALGPIQKSLQAPDLSGLESFELLLEISQLDGTPRQTRLLSWRVGHPQER